MRLKRPLCIVAVFYMIGIIMGLYLTISIIFFLFILIILGMFLFHISRKDMIFFLVMLCVGVFSIKVIDKAYENVYQFCKQEEQYYIKAVVVSEKVEREYKDVYYVEIKEINGNAKCNGTKWLLNIKKGKDNEKINLQYGDLIEAKISFEIPSKARNYMGFDYQNYLKSKKLYGNMIVKDNIKILSNHQSNLLDTMFYKVATDIKSNMYKVLPQNVREVCVGILIGERSNITEEISQAFRKSNLTHMLAVSGAHVSYVILGIGFIVDKINKKTSKIFTIIFLVFFMGITKFTPSVERASFMAILILLSSLVHRKSDIYINLAISVIIILFSNPYSILDIGFQLSYGGTLGIVLLNKKISEKIYVRLQIGSRKIIKYIIDMLVVTISANIIIIPIMIFQFNTLSVTFWISNILAGPFLGCITILGFMVYLISIFSVVLASIFAIPLQYLIQVLIFIAKVCSRLPFSSIIVKTPYVIEMILYYLVIYIVIQLEQIKEKIKEFCKAYRKVILKQNTLRWCISFISIIIIIFVAILVRQNKNFKIYFVDVGQGDCTLIITPQKRTILIDGGGSENSSFDVGKQTLYPYLLDRRITQIDYVIISHFDTDHVRRDIVFIGKYESKKCNHF